MKGTREQTNRLLDERQTGSVNLIAQITEAWDKADQPTRREAIKYLRANVRNRR